MNEESKIEMKRVPQESLEKVPETILKNESVYIEPNFNGKEFFHTTLILDNILNLNLGLVEIQNNPTPTSDDELYSTVNDVANLNLIDSNAKPIIDAKSIQEFKCTNCDEFLSTPIYFTQENKNICETCNNSRPLRKLSIFEKRNIGLEDYIQYFPYPCKYKQKGCEHIITVKDTLIHENRCIYRDLSCPFQTERKCSWRGSFKNFKNHYEQNHIDHVVNGPYIINENFKVDFEKSFILKSYLEFLFLVQLSNDSKSKKCFVKAYVLNEDTNFEKIFMIRFVVLNTDPDKLSNGVLHGLLEDKYTEKIEKDLTVDFTNVFEKMRGFSCSINITLKCTTCNMTVLLSNVQRLYCSDGKYYCSFCMCNLQNHLKTDRDKEAFREFISNTSFYKLENRKM